MSKIKWLLIFILAAVIVFIGFVFSTENADQVSPTVIGIRLWELNLGLWLFIVFLLGAVAGYVVSWITTWRIKSQKRSMDRKLNKKDKEISRLRSATTGH